MHMQLLIDDLSSSEDPKDQDRLETVRDVSEACGVALDTLNQLLAVGQWERGLLKLNKEEVPVQAFVAGCVGMFSSQVGALSMPYLN
jgi:signal transduction histidine kinase